MIKITTQELNKLKRQKKVKSVSVSKSKPEAPKQTNDDATLKLADAINNLAVKRDDSLDMQPLVDALTVVQRNQAELTKSLREKPKPQQWEFAVKRDHQGNIDRIFAKETGNV